jgi:hypothetical protein
MQEAQNRLNATAALRMTDEQFQKHRAAEVERRAQFAQSYPQIASVIDKTIVSNLPSDVDAREVIVPTQGRNEEEDEKLAEVRKVHRRMAEAGVIPATIVNLLPWEVQGTGVHLMYSDMTVPRCPIGQAYELKIIRAYKIDIEDKGGRFGADVVTPIGMANDIVRQLQPQKRGGIFHYMGDHLPGENPKTRDREMKDWDKAKKDMIRHFRQLYREAESFYQQTSRRGLLNIVEGHRMACQWLLHFRFVSEVPAWLTATREEGDVPDSCPGCGQEPGGGFQCTNCGYITQPLAAFEAGEIEDDHQALRRLSREELDSVGLDYVMTKAEYREARRKLAIEGEDADVPEAVRTGRNSKKNGRKKPAKPIEEETKE